MIPFKELEVKLELVKKYLKILQQNLEISIIDCIQPQEYMTLGIKLNVNAPIM